MINTIYHNFNTLIKNLIFKLIFLFFFLFSNGRFTLLLNMRN